MNGGASYQLGKFDLIGAFTFRGKRQLEETITTNVEELEKAQFNLNLMTRYDITEKNRIYLQVQNVLGAENWVPLSANGFAYPMNGRMFYVGFNHDF